MMLKYIILFVLAVNVVSGYTQVQYSTDNLTWFNATNENENKTVIETTNNGIEENKLYYFRIRHHYDSNITEWVYVNDVSDVSGETPMSSLAVIGFVTIVSLSIIIFPKFIKSFSKFEYVDTIIRGSTLALGLFMLSLSTAMVATISENFSLGITDEVFTFLWLIRWAGYSVIFFVVLFYAKRAIQQWGTLKSDRRMMLDDEN